jgi:cytochrome c5
MFTSLPVMAAIEAEVNHKSTSEEGTTQDSANTSTPEHNQNAESAESLGRMLYENHCTRCHESAVHMRENRKAKNFKDLTYWVNQRADWLGLGWTLAEKRAVMDYVNEEYYKYSPE